MRTNQNIFLKFRNQNETQKLKNNKKLILCLYIIIFKKIYK